MKDLMDRIFSSPMLTLLILGLICLVLGTGGGFRLGTFSWEIDANTGKLILEATGALLILAGLFALWVNLEKDQSFGYKYGWGLRPNILKCKGTLKDLYLFSHETIKKMPADRNWKYELKDVVIKQYPRNIRIDFNVIIKYPAKDGGDDFFRCSGFGPFDGKVAYVKYGFYADENKLSNPQWTGVLVLRIPKSKTIDGVWMSASANRDRIFPLGSITLQKIEN